MQSNETTRVVMSAFGLALLIVVVVPILIMAGMMGAMMDGISGMMGGWVGAGMVLLILTLGSLLVAITFRDRRGKQCAHHGVTSCNRKESTTWPQGLLGKNVCAM